MSYFLPKADVLRGVVGFAVGFAMRAPAAVVPLLDDPTLPTERSEALLCADTLLPALVLLLTLPVADALDFLDAVERLLFLLVLLSALAAEKLLLPEPIDAILPAADAGLELLLIDGVLIGARADESAFILIPACDNASLSFGSISLLASAIDASSLTTASIVFLTNLSSMSISVNVAG